MNDVDLPDGPVTPNGIRRIFVLALVFASLVIFGAVFEIRLLKWMGDVGLNNLLLIVPIVGIAIFLYKIREPILSILT